MIKSKKYFTLFLVPLLFLFFTVSFSSCDPHRAGSVIKGPNKKSTRHHRPASAKRRKKMSPKK